MGRKCVNCLKNDYSPLSQRSPPRPNGHSQYCSFGDRSSKAQEPPGPQSFVHVSAVCVPPDKYEADKRSMSGFCEVSSVVNDSFRLLLSTDMANSAENEASFWYRISSSSCKPYFCRDDVVFNSERKIEGIKKQFLIISSSGIRVE